MLTIITKLHEKKNFKNNFKAQECRRRVVCVKKSCVRHTHTLIFSQVKQLILVSVHGEGVREERINNMDTRKKE